jgi:hypothetical protein
MAGKVQDKKWDLIKNATSKSSKYLLIILCRMATFKLCRCENAFSRERMKKMGGMTPHCRSCECWKLYGPLSRLSILWGLVLFHHLRRETWRMETPPCASVGGYFWEILKLLLFSSIDKKFKIVDYNNYYRVKHKFNT